MQRISGKDLVGTTIFSGGEEVAKDEPNPRPFNKRRMDTKWKTQPSGANLGSDK